MEARTRKIVIHLLPAALIALSGALFSATNAQTAASGPPGSAMHESKSIADVSKQLNTPVADLWALNFQFNRYYLQGVDYMAIHPVDFGQHWGLRFQIIPVLPELFKDTLF